VITHSLYPRTGNPDKGGTGHLSKDDGTAYCVDTGNCQGVEVMMRDGRDNRSCLRSGRTPEVGYKGNSIRRLTPIECERLQGFPDDWTKGLSDTQRYKCLGNAVTVNVISAIAKSLYRSYNLEIPQAMQPLKGISAKEEK